MCGTKHHTKLTYSSAWPRGGKLPSPLRREGAWPQASGHTGKRPTAGRRHGGAGLGLANPEHPGGAGTGECTGHQKLHRPGRFPWLRPTTEGACRMNAQFWCNEPRPDRPLVRWHSGIRRETPGLAWAQRGHQCGAASAPPARPGTEMLWVPVSLNDYSIQRSILNEKYFPHHVYRTLVL